jgi:hypothetical protein
VKRLSPVARPPPVGTCGKIRFQRTAAGVGWRTPQVRDGMADASSNDRRTQTTAETRPSLLCGTEFAPRVGDHPGHQGRGARQPGSRLSGRRRRRRPLSSTAIRPHAIPNLGRQPCGVDNRAVRPLPGRRSTWVRRGDGEDDEGCLKVAVWSGVPSQRADPQPDARRRRDQL